MTSAHPILQNYDALLVDLDGTVFEGDTAIDGAAEGMARHLAAQRVVYVTNNASRTPEDVAQHLTRVGFPTSADFVLTSAMAAAELVRDDAAQRSISAPTAYIIGAPALRVAAEQQGIAVVDSADEQPDYVLHGHSPENNWQRLSEGALAIGRGATYIATNRDTTLPHERGLLLGNGSLVAAVTAATGVTPRSAGKPEPTLFHTAARLLGVQRPLVVGDRLNTDIAGGNAAGMDTLCTVTGVSGHWEILRAPAEQRPSFIAATMQDHQAGWSAEQHSNVRGEHTIRISSPAGAEEKVALGAAEALAVAAPFAWALQDSGVAADSIVYEGCDPVAQRAVDAWR